MENVNLLWDLINKKLQSDLDIPLPAYEAWLKTLEPICIADDAIVLCARTDSVRRRVIDKYMHNIITAARQVKCPIGKFTIIIPGEKAMYLTPADSESEPEEESDEGLEFDQSIDTSDAYRFSNFVIGNCNQFAAACANAVVNNPGLNSNPLMIYGGVGLGKTHILKAIALELKRKYPKMKVYYITSDTFSKNYIYVSSKGRMSPEYSAFRKFYNTLDALIMDDVQFLSKKTASQEELFHIFNNLYDAKKQIVLSCDRPLNEVKELEERLISRFKWGLTAELTMPDYETKFKILKNKAQEHNMILDDDVIDYLANKDVLSIRELEGMLNSIILFIQLYNSPNSSQLELAREALKDTIEPSLEKISIQIIIEKVAEYYGLTVADIIGKRRNKEFVEPRQIAMYLITKLLPLVPLITIGKKFSNRDHSTVIHSRNKISEELTKNPALRQTIVDIEGLILKK